jgi:DNA-binding NarL/FixJ family response regulator
VKNHVSNILHKLGVRDRTRAVLKALERGDV